MGLVQHKALKECALVLCLLPRLREQGLVSTGEVPAPWPSLLPARNPGDHCVHGPAERPLFLRSQGGRIADCRSVLYNHTW